MMPDQKEYEQKPAEPGFAPVEKMFQFLVSLHGRIDHAKGLLERFQREFRELDDEERGVLMTQSYSILRIVINDLLALATTRGEEENLRDMLAAAISDIKDETYEADFERILQLLLVAESQLEVWQMLLTNQPVPTDWAAEVWEQMVMEVRETALKEYVAEQRGRAKTALESGEDIPADIAERLADFVDESDDGSDDGTDDGPEEGEDV